MLLAEWGETLSLSFFEPSLNKFCSDSEMYKTMAELDVPVCLMHMRGDPTTMTNLKDYENDDVVGGVR